MLDNRWWPKEKLLCYFSFYKITSLKRYSKTEAVLTHLSQMDFPTIIIWNSPV